MRAWKQNAASQRTCFLYDGNVPARELDANGRVHATNGCGPTSLLARVGNPTDVTVLSTWEPCADLAQTSIPGGHLPLTGRTGRAPKTGSYSNPFRDFGGQLSKRFCGNGHARFLNPGPIGTRGGRRMLGPSLQGDRGHPP